MSDAEFFQKLNGTLEKITSDSSNADNFINYGNLDNDIIGYTKYNKTISRSIANSSKISKSSSYSIGQYLINAQISGIITEMPTSVTTNTLIAETFGVGYNENRTSYAPYIEGTQVSSSSKESSGVGLDKTIVNSGFSYITVIEYRTY